MPRYLVERTFADGINLPVPHQAGAELATFLANNAHEAVTWIHAYVSQDLKKAYCVYEAASPDAIRRAARRNNLPVDRIVEIRHLDPYSYAPLGTAPSESEA